MTIEMDADLGCDACVELHSHHSYVDGSDTYWISFIDGENGNKVHIATDRIDLLIDFLKSCKKMIRIV